MAIHPGDFHPHLRFSDRLAALAAWGMAIALFVTVGWMALRPRDPEGAVTMLTDPSPWAMVAQMAALGTVVAAIATVLAGRKLADAGVFATCLGIAVANLRGETLASVLMGIPDDGAGVRREIAARFMLETLVWFGIVLLAMIVSALVVRWCFRAAEAELAPLLSSLSAAHLPIAADWVRPQPDANIDSAPDTGLRHTAAVVLGAIVLIRVFTGSPDRAITHGQVYFSVAAAFCAAGYVIQIYLPTRTPLWTCLAVPIVAVLAYGWTIVTSGPQGPHPATIPASAYLRALPVEYVMLGTLGSVLSFWWSRAGYAARLAMRQTKRTGR